MAILLNLVKYADHNDRVQDNDLEKNTISSLGHSVPKRCQTSAASTTSSTLRLDVIVTR